MLKYNVFYIIGISSACTYSAIIILYHVIISKTQNLDVKIRPYKLKACLHCTLEPVSTVSGTGSARPH